MQRKSWVGRIKNSERRVREEPNPTWKTCLFFQCMFVCDMHVFACVCLCVICMSVCIFLRVCVFVCDMHVFFLCVYTYGGICMPICGCSWKSASIPLQPYSLRQRISSKFRASWYGWFWWLHSLGFESQAGSHAYLTSMKVSRDWNSSSHAMWQAIWAISLALEELTVKARCISELLWIGHSFCSTSLFLGTGTCSVLSLPVY